MNLCSLKPFASLFPQINFPAGSYFRRLQVFGISFLRVLARILVVDTADRLLACWTHELVQLRHLGQCGRHGRRVLRRQWGVKLLVPFREPSGAAAGRPRFEFWRLVDSLGIQDVLGVRVLNAVAVPVVMTFLLGVRVSVSLARVGMDVEPGPAVVFVPRGTGVVVGLRIGSVAERHGESKK